MHENKVRGPRLRGQAPAQHEDNEEGVALMEGESDGISGGTVGELRPFAHRDIKPGKFGSLPRLVSPSMVRGAAVYYHLPDI